MVKPLRLSSDLQRHIFAHCEAEYPDEACGLLLGHCQDDGSMIVTDVILSANISESPKDSFEIDPAVIIDHHRQAREGGKQVIGHFHSHPDGPAEPSSRDQAQNYDENLVWLIIAASKAGYQDMKAFAVDKALGRLLPVPVE